MRWSVTLLFYLSNSPSSIRFYIFLFWTWTATQHNNFAAHVRIEVKHVEKESNNNSKKIYCTATIVYSRQTDRWTNTSVKANQIKKGIENSEMKRNATLTHFLFSLAREPNRQANIKIHVSTGWNFTAFYSIDTSFIHTRPQTTSHCFGFFFFF